MIHSRLIRAVMVTGIFIAVVTFAWARSLAQSGDIVYGQSISGSLKSGVTDNLSFVGTAGDIIAIAVERTSGDLEPILKLTDPAQFPVVGTQAISGQGAVSLMQVRLSHSGSYVISLNGGSKTEGEYKLTLTLTTPSPITPTPQATVVADVIAGTINPGARVRGELGKTIYRQLWNFRGAFGDVFDIRMARLSGDLDTALTLISPIGDIVAASSSESGGPDAGILGFQLPYTGTYTIIARREGPNLGVGGTTSGRYELSLSSRGPDSAAQNTLLEPGVTLKGRITDNAPVALYRLSFGGAMAFSLDLSSLHRLARIRILTTEGKVLLEQKGLSPLLISARLPDKGPFLIEATSITFENAPFTDFNLTAHRLSANIAKEPAEPRALRYGDKRQTVIAGVDNWFFQGHLGDLISVGINPGTVSVPSKVRISGPQDILLFQGDLGSSFHKVLTLAADGIYEIEVRPVDSSTPLPYALSLDRIGANGNAFGLYTLAPEQGTITVNTPLASKLEAGSAHAWWLDATAGEVASFTVNVNTGGAKFGLAIQRPDGSLIDVQATDRVGGGVIQQVVLDQTGRFRILVFDLAQTGGDYVLTYEESTGGLLEAGRTVKGIALPANSYSSWALDVTAGSLINVRLSTLTARDWSPLIMVARPDGRIIASSETGLGNNVSLLGVAAPTTGTYRVVVGGVVDSSFASYNLLTNVQPPFGADSGASTRLPINKDQTIRYAAPPTTETVHINVSDLISPSVNSDIPTNVPLPPIDYGNIVRGEISVGKFSQVWQFGGVKDQTISLVATSLSDGIGPDLILINADGKIVREQLHADDATTVLTYRMPQGGQYRLLVRKGLSGGRYLLSLNTVPVALDKIQIAAGRPLIYGQTLAGEILPEVPENRFYFQGSIGDIVSVRLARSSGNLTPALHLFAPNGKEVGTDRNDRGTPKASINAYRLPDNGVFTLVVNPSELAAEQIGSYLLYIGLDSASRLVSRGGGIITSGETVSGFIALPDNQDTWLFQGRSGERVTFVATGVGAPLLSPLGLRLQDTAGRTFAGQDITLTQGAVRLSNVMLPYDGIYRIQVTGATNTAGVYSLTWQPDQERLLAGPVRYNQTVNGLFTTSRNADTWTFAGTAGDVVSISFNYERGDRFQGGFQVRSENGLQLSTVADIGNGLGARVESLLLPFSGSYSVVVANPDTNYKGAGIYSLSIDLEDSKARSIGSILKYGQHGHGDIYIDDQVDTWVFAAKAGDVVNISVEARDQFLKPVVELRDQAGTVLASALAAGESVSGPLQLKDFKIAADGVYVINISGGEKKTSGSYLLALDYTPPPLPENATLNYGDTKEGLIAGDRPTQLYAFSARQGDVISATVIREPGSNLDAVVTLQAANGQHLTSASSNGTDSVTLNNFRLPQTGRYLLAVSRYRGAQGETVGRFKVNLTGRSESISVKGSVGYGQQAIGRLGDDVPHERITFEGKAGDVIGITSETTSGDLDSRLSLENSSGTVLATNDDTIGTTAGIAAVLLPADDTYTVVISRVGTKTVGSSGNYSLVVNRLYQLNPTAVPQNLITYGKRVIGAVDANNAEVRYTFSGNQGDEISMLLLHQTDESPPLLTVQDPANTVLARGVLGTGQTSIDNYKLPVDGLYTLVIRHPPDARERYSPFALTLSLLSTPAARSTAGGILALNDTVTGTFTAGQSSHYWLFEAGAGQLVTINLLQLTSDFLPSVILVSPNGQSLVSFTATTRDQLAAALAEYKLPSDGIYSLIVVPGGTSRAGQYRLTIQPLNAPAASPVTLQAGQTVSGTIDGLQPEQHWTFNGQPGQSISARMLITTGPLEPRLKLVSPQGQVLAEGSTEQLNNKSVTLNATLPAAGVYTLVAGQQNQLAQAAGTYRLGLELGALSAQAVAALPLSYSQAVRKAVQQNSTDYWIFNGVKGDPVTVAVTVTDDSQAPGIVLQDSGGRILTQVPAGSTSDSNIEGYILPADGRYVVALNAPATTTYTLVVQRRQVDLPEGITPRPLIANQRQDGTITPSAKINYWSFDAQAGDVIQIDANRLSGDLRLDLVMYGPSKTYVTSALADPASGNLRLGAVRLTESGKFTLVATRWLGTNERSAGRYSLTFSKPDGESGSVGGHIPAYGQTVTGGITGSDDNDVWTFEGQAGEIVDVRLKTLNGDLVPTLKLVEPGDTKEIASVAAESNEAVLSRVILTATGRFSVVAGRTGNTSGGYQLILNQVQSAINAGMARAQGITYGEDRQGELTSTTPVLAWVFFGKAGERISTEASATEGGVLDPYIYLVAPDGSTIAADDNSMGGTSARIGNQQLPTDGFYGIVVSGSPLRQAEQKFGNFRLILRRDQPGAVFQGDVQVGNRVQGVLSPDQPVHEWTFLADASKTIAASLISNSTNFNGIVSITSQDGKLLASSAPSQNGTASVEALLPGPGWYAVLISSGASGAAGQYNLQVSYALAPSGGGVLVSGQTGSGTIDNIDFTDTWRVVVGDNQTLTVDLSRITGDVDLQLTLFAPDGTEIPIDKIDGTGIRVEKSQLAPGSYMLMVSREGAATGRTTGDYSLQVKLAQP